MFAEFSMNRTEPCPHLPNEIPRQPVKFCMKIVSFLQQHISSPIDHYEVIYLRRQRCSRSVSFRIHCKCIYLAPVHTYKYACALCPQRLSCGGGCGAAAALAPRDNEVLFWRFFFGWQVISVPRGCEVQIVRVRVASALLSRLYSIING